MLFFGWFKKKKKVKKTPVRTDPNLTEPVIPQQLVTEPKEKELEPVQPEEVPVSDATEVDDAPIKVEPVDETVEEEPKDESVDLESLTVKELKELAKERGLSGYSSLKKAELIDLLK